MPVTKIISGKIQIVEANGETFPYERFTVTLNPNGTRTLRAVTRSPRGDLLRDVNMLVDAAWKPIEGMSRLFLKGESLGTVLRRVSNGRMDSYVWSPGQPIDHAVFDFPDNATLGFHPITGDAWKTNFLDTSHTGDQEVAVYTVADSWYGGALGHGVLLLSTAAYEGEEELETPVGRVAAQRFLWKLRAGKLIRIWRTGEARLLAKMEVIAGERPGTVYWLSQVEEELVAAG